MALARAFDSKYEDLHANRGLTHDELHAAEMEAFGADHAQVGAWLLERWRVPSQLAKLMQYSHDSRPLEKETPQPFFLARCVEYSGRLADLWSSGDSEVALRLAEAEAAALFGEGKIDIGALGARIMEAVTEVAPLFELKINNEEMSLVLEQAQEAMASSVLRLEAAT